jgi:hypothetical protein
VRAHVDVEQRDVIDLEIALHVLHVLDAFLDVPDRGLGLEPELLALRARDVVEAADGNECEHREQRRLREPGQRNSPREPTAPSSRRPRPTPSNGKQRDGEWVDPAERLHPVAADVDRVERRRRARGPEERALVAAGSDERREAARDARDEDQHHARFSPVHPQDAPHRADVERPRELLREPRIAVLDLATEVGPGARDVPVPHQEQQQDRQREECRPTVSGPRTR